jgi:hypothetical protein
MNARTTDPVRLPARGSGYTSANHRAIHGVGREVDPDVLDAYAKTARERAAERNRQRLELVRRETLRMIGSANTLHALLKATHGIDPATRNRARRAVHDLQQIAKELDTDGKEDGGPCKVSE